MEISQRTRAAAIWENIVRDKRTQLNIDFPPGACLISWGPNFNASNVLTSVLPSRLDSERSGGGPPYFISPNQLTLNL